MTIERAKRQDLDCLPIQTGGEMMDEYISREEAKRYFGLNFGSVSHAIIAARLLDEIPAADVSPVRHGRWLCVDTDTEQFFLCNICEKKEYWESNYCPNCGAKMDLEV